MLFMTTSGVMYWLSLSCFFPFYVKWETLSTSQLMAARVGSVVVIFPCENCPAESRCVILIVSRRVACS